MIKIKCSNCENIFEKNSYEYKRNLVLGRKNYCSRSCRSSCKENIKKLANNRSGYDISKHSGNRRDRFTGFRSILRNVNKRKKIVTITLEDMKRQWKNQNGRCVYSGVALQLPKWKKIPNDPIRTASLDRIDSSKGYEKDNIQFVSISLNLAKNTMSHEQMIELCSLIRNYEVTES